MKKKYRYPRRPGKGNYPFYKKWWDKFYTKPGYQIRASKNNPRKLRKAKYDKYPGLPF